MTLEATQTLLETFGVPVAMLCYFVARDYWQSKRNDAREQELTQRLQALEDYQKDTLQSLAISSNTALSEAAKAQSEAAKALHELVTILATKPCVADSIRRER